MRHSAIALGWVCEVLCEGHLQSSLFSVVLLIASTLGTAVDAASPAGDALEAYRAAARDAGAGGLDREATEGWIGRLSDAAADGDPLAEEALASARRLANSIGAWDESSRIVARELLIHATRDADRARLCSEAGEIRRNLSRQTKRSEDRRAAIGAFAEASAVIEGLPPDADGEMERRSSVILNTIWIAELESECTDEPERSRALDTWRRARETYEALLAEGASPVGALLMTRWTIPKIAAREAMHALLLERYSVALPALRAIGDPSADVTSPATCIQEAANRFPAPSRRDPDGYVRFLREWLDVGPAEARTCFVRWLLAEALAARGDREEARAILATLRDQSLFEFDRVEPAALEQGSGGTYSMVLRRLRDLQAEAGDIDGALATNATYLDLYPNETGLVDEARNFAARRAEARAAVEAALDAPARPTSRRWLLVGINAAIVAAVSWLLYRRNRLHSSRGG
jgi:hypothetical protein